MLNSNPKLVPRALCSGGSRTGSRSPLNYRSEQSSFFVCIELLLARHLDWAPLRVPRADHPWNHPPPSRVKLWIHKCNAKIEHNVSYLEHCGGIWQTLNPSVSGLDFC